MRVTLVARCSAVLVVLLSGCGAGSDEDAVASFASATGDQSITMRERAALVRSAGREAASRELAASMSVVADRADDVAAAREAATRLFDRREEGLANDMVESFIRGTAGDPFGRVNEMVAEDSAMRSRNTAAEEAYITAVRRVTSIMERDQIPLPAPDNEAAESQSGWQKAWPWLVVGFILWILRFGSGAEAAAPAAKKTPSS